MHPLEAYLAEAKPLIQEEAVIREDIAGLVNDEEALRDACAEFRELKNADTSCHAMGKVYEAQGQSYGCVCIASEDVARLAGEGFSGTLERINQALLSAFLDFTLFCRGRPELYPSWDGYLEQTLGQGFPSLYANGMRARLLYNGRICAARLPMVLFILYQAYDAIYG